MNFLNFKSLMSLKSAKFKNMLRTYCKFEERRGTSISDTVQDLGNIFSCFSANIHHFNIVFSVVHVQVCFKSFIIIIIIFHSCRPG